MHNECQTETVCTREENTMLKKQIIVFAIALVLLFCWGTQAMAYTVQEKAWNNTGQHAHDLTKILLGYWVITDAIHDAFANHTVVHVGPFTAIHWDGGAGVPAGGWTWACFTTASGVRAPVIAAFWTDAAGNIIGPAAIEPSISTSTGLNDISVTLTHEAISWDGAGWPISEGDAGDPLGNMTLTQIAWAPADQTYSMNELNDELPVSWSPFSDTVIAYGGTATYDIGSFEMYDVVLFRVTSQVGSTPAATTVMQFQMPQVPSLTEWGLIALAVLVLATGVWVVIRRRRTVSSTA